MFKKLILVLGLTLGTLGFSLDPTELQIKVYKVSFSNSELCTNPVTVMSKADADATYVDFLDSPNLAENASLDDGTYNCVIIEMSDLIRFTPASTSGTCSAGTQYTLDVCRGNQGGTFTLTDGTTGTCNNTNGTEDKVALYISTASTATTGGSGSNGFQPPTSSSDSAHGFNLTAAFTKSGSATKVFYVDGTGKVSPGSSCDMNPPIFGFR